MKNIVLEKLGVKNELWQSSWYLQVNILYIEFFLLSIRYVHNTFIYKKNIVLFKI
jgi:hypothetical protein